MVALVHIFFDADWIKTELRRGIMMKKNLVNDVLSIMEEKEKKFEESRLAAESWNKKYNIGTEVIATGSDGKEYKAVTGSPALCFGDEGYRIELFFSGVCEWAPITRVRAKN